MTTITELSKTVMEWAQQRTEPFTSFDAYTGIDEAVTSDLVSQTVSHLYRKGQLARKRIDKVRFSYALSENAPEGFETIAPVPTKEQMPEQIVETKPPVVETKTPADEMPARKTETNDTGKPAPQAKREKVEEFMVPEIGKIEIPENFILSLRTPGGLEITIKTGIL